MLRFAVLVAVVTFCCQRFFTAVFSKLSLPPPYNDGTAMEISDGFVERLAGNPKGSALPRVLEGKWAPNDRLKNHSTRLLEGMVEGSESVGTFADGTLVMIDKFGWVWTSPAAATATRRWYVGPGRPLGFHVFGSSIYVACSLKGLLKLDTTSTTTTSAGQASLEVLANVATDTQLPLNYVNDLDVAPNGDVYFTSSTERGVPFDAKKGFYDTMYAYLMNLCKGDATGRLLKYDASTRTTTTLMSGLWYANGVALASDLRSVLVVETNLNRIHRYWLASGTSEIFVDQLPGVPDGISRSYHNDNDSSKHDGYWIAAVTPVSPLSRFVAPRPRLRGVLAHFVATLLPYVVKPTGIVFRVDMNGNPSDALYDLEGTRVSSVSSVAQHGSTLYLGNLNGNYVSRIEL